MAKEKKEKKETKGKKKSKLKIVLIIVAVVIVIFGVMGYSCLKTLKNISASFEQEVVVQEFGEQDMSSNLSVTGTVESQNVENITTSLVYPISEIKVSVGDKVKEGDVVCTIDTTEIDKTIKSLEAQASDQERLEAKQLEISRRQLQRTEKSQSNEVAKAAKAVTDAKDEWDKADSAYYDAVDALAEAEKALADATSSNANVPSTDNTASATDAISDSNSSNQLLIPGYSSSTVTMTDEEKAVAEAEANLTTANATWYEKKAVYDAAVSTYETMISAKDEAVAAATDSNELAEAQKSTYSALSEQLATAYEQKEDSVILAEVSGVVTAVTGVEGLPASGSILQIEDEDNLKINVQIKEKNVFDVKVGQKVEITNDSLEESVGTGTVTKINTFVASNNTAQSASSLLAQSSDTTTYYSAEITVEESSNLLLGMKVKNKIYISENDTKFAVPYTAITEDEEGKSYVYVAEKLEGTEGYYSIVKKNIEVGGSGDYYTEITGGSLVRGDLVVSYPEFVFEGEVVLITKQDSSAESSTEE